MRRALAWGVVLLAVLGPQTSMKKTYAGDDEVNAPGHHEIPDQPPGAKAAPRGRAAPDPARNFGIFFPVVQVNVDASGNNIPGDAANEPSIAVDPSNPDHMVIGWRQFDTIASNFRQAGVAYSQDAGQTWIFNGSLDAGNFRSDPVLNADAYGRFYYNSLNGNMLCDIFISDDGGVTWSPPIPAYGGDKAWVVIDTVSPVGFGNIYSSWNIFFGCCEENVFTRSVDDGTTFSYPIRVLGDPIFGTLAVGPDGELYVTGVAGGNYSDFIVVKSTDAQDPFSPPTFAFSTSVDLGGSMVLGDGPNPGGLLGQAWVAVDRSDGPTRGNVYLLCSVDPPGPDPLDVNFCRSTDGGLTWSAPIRVNDDLPENGAWQWFGTMSVAPNGRIDVIWNDTRDDPSGTYSVLYRSCSADGGLTFSANVPLTIPFNHFLGYPQQAKLGDYDDMISDDSGADIAFAATFNGEQDVYYLRLDYDCNHNGVPDDDDILLGTSFDCNENGLPDECDTAYGLSPDGDGNGIPDECEACAAAELFSSEPDADDNLGRAVAISGNAAIAAAAGDDDNGTDAGAAIVFRGVEGSWLQETKLLASDGSAEDDFGSAVAISGDIALIGAQRDDDHGENSGSAYLFCHNGSTWYEKAKLLASDGAPDDAFGASVAIDGDALIVGAYKDDDNGNDSGSAYVFRHDGQAWIEEAKLIPADGAPSDLFGWSVGISGDLAIVSANWNDHVAPNAGAAYIFRFDGSHWTEEAKLTASDADKDDFFGWSVAISGDLAIVGASYNDDLGSKSGSAYAYKYDAGAAQWIETKLLPTDGATSDRFGHAVALDGNLAIVGSYGDSDNGANAGSAYAFRYDKATSQWLQEAKLLAPEGGVGDYFGCSVSVSGDLGLVGARSDDDAGLDAGSAYIFAGLSGADCNENGLPDACDILGGLSDDINANGVPDECECPADLNEDGKVNIDDLFVILAAWGTCDDCPEDINRDGKVNIDDVFIVLGDWGLCD